MNYAQSVIFTEEFATLTYVMSITMTSGGIFLNMPVIIAALLTLSIDLKKELDKNPSFPLVSQPMVKGYILKGAAQQMQDYGRMVRSDIEVYAGFYLVGTIFLGQNSLIGAMFYW